MTGPASMMEVYRLQRVKGFFDYWTAQSVELPQGIQMCQTHVASFLERRNFAKLHRDHHLSFLFGVVLGV